MIGRGRDLSQRRDRLTFKVKGTAVRRLDHYVLSTLQWKSRTRIQELICEGRIRVNGAATKPAWRVKPGDEISITLSHGAGMPDDYDALQLDVLYEDPWLVAVNKPPGMLVHPVGRHVYDTLINYLHHRYRDAVGENDEALRPRLCHRIDKDTTGIVVVGKDVHAHREVRVQFESRLVSKEYVALVAGEYPREREVLTAPMGEGRSLEACLEHESLKEARTTVEVLRRLRGHTLLSCVPHTGRLNQIRVHLAGAGFPIAGDERFGGDPPRPGFPARYLLHSRVIRFDHPRLKSLLELTAPLPPDLVELLARLE